MDWTLGLGFANFVFVVATWWYAWASNRRRATTEQIERIEGQYNDLRREVDRMDARVDAAPSHDDMSALHTRINELSGAVRELVGVMSAVQRSLDRVETKLMNEERR